MAINLNVAFSLDWYQLTALIAIVISISAFSVPFLKTIVDMLSVLFGLDSSGTSGAAGAVFGWYVTSAIFAGIALVISIVGGIISGGWLLAGIAILAVMMLLITLT